MGKTDNQDAKELEELSRLVGSKKLNLPKEQLSQQEASALLRYIDSLEAKSKPSGMEHGTIQYDQKHLDTGLKKLIGIAAAPQSKDEVNQD